MERERKGVEIDDDSWVAVGWDLRRALAEVSHRIGGEIFMEEVLSAAGDPKENVLPNPACFLLLGRQDPDGPIRVLNRAEEMQQHRLKFI